MILTQVQIQEPVDDMQTTLKVYCHFNDGTLLVMNVSKFPIIYQHRGHESEFLVTELRSKIMEMHQYITDTNLIITLEGKDADESKNSGV